MNRIILPKPIPLQPIAPPSADLRWQRELGRAHQTFHEMGHAIASATTSGKRLYPVVRDFLRNPKVRTSAAARALGGTPDRETVMVLRDRVDAWATEYAPIVWFHMRKASGSTRPICILPPELKAVHYMIAEVIKQQFERSDAHYGVVGFSRDDAARVLKALQSAGYVHLAKTDIVDCFQRISPDALYELPLPKEVTHRALDTRNMTFIEQGHQKVSQPSYGSSLYEYDLPHNASGPKGIMQGSPASSIILSWLMSGLPERDDIKVILCFDNIVVASKTETGSREMVDTLAAYFERCSAGPLALCVPEFADNTPLEFLGYIFDPARGDIGISENALNRLEGRLVSREAEDAAELRHLFETHQRLASDNSLFDHFDPLNGHFPVGVWQELRDFRAGFPAASSYGQELRFYLENSEHVADMRNDWHVKHFHNNLFAPRDTPEGTIIRQILKSQTPSK